MRPDGTPIEGNKVSHEREMSVVEVKDRLKREKRGGKSLYDYVTQKGFFRLGARVKCPNCSRHSWYSLESIGDSLSCPKCLDVFPAVGNLDAGGKIPLVLQDGRSVQHPELRGRGLLGFTHPEFF